jgi:hypothetical protein
MAEVTGKAGVQSLADYVVSLSAGNRCFCCGKPLQPYGENPSEGPTSTRLERLTCPHCGSEVADILGTPSAKGNECMAFVGVERTAA